MGAARHAAPLVPFPIRSCCGRWASPNASRLPRSSLSVRPAGFGRLPKRLGDRPAGAPRPPGRGPLLGALLYVLEVLSYGALPLGPHPAASSDPSEDEEVDSDLPFVVQLRAPVGLLERELLDRVGHGPGEVPESHPGRRLELDRLDGPRGVEVDPGVMRGNDKRVASRQDLDPGAARDSARVGGLDDLEDEIARSVDADRDRAERVDAPAPAEVEGEPAHGEQEERSGPPGDEQDGEDPDRDPQAGHRAVTSE